MLVNSLAVEIGIKLWSLELGFIALLTILTCPFRTLEFFYLHIWSIFRRGWYRTTLCSSCSSLSYRESGFMNRNACQIPELEVMDEDRHIEEVLDKFVNCHEQTYEEFLSTFTHLSKGKMEK